MLYPRWDSDCLVTEEQMVGYREHMTRAHRTLFLTGFIGARCSNCGAGESESHNLLMALDTLSHDPIKMVITSPGGDLDLTFLLYDTMKLIRSPIITIGRYCTSGAALLLAAGTKRYLLPHAKVMLHKPWGRREGDSRDFEIQGREMKKYEQGYITALQECGVVKDYNEVLNDIDRDLWLEPQEAIEYGLVDEIISPQIMEEWLK